MATHQGKAPAVSAGSSLFTRLSRGRRPAHVLGLSPALAARLVRPAPRALRAVSRRPRSVGSAALPRRASCPRPVSLRRRPCRRRGLRPLSQSLSRGRSLRSSGVLASLPGPDPALPLVSPAACLGLSSTLLSRRSQRPSTPPRTRTSFPPPLFATDPYEHRPARSARRRGAYFPWSLSTYRRFTLSLFLGSNFPLLPASFPRAFLARACSFILG